MQICRQLQSKQKAELLISKEAGGSEGGGSSWRSGADLFQRVFESSKYRSTVNRSGDNPPKEARRDGGEGDHL